MSEDGKFGRFATALSGLILGVALLGFAGAPASAQNLPEPANAAPLRLQAGTFTPSLGEGPNLPPGLTIFDYAAGEAGDYIVQFDRPVGQAQRGALAGLGARVLGYLPDFAFKVRMTPAQADAADGLVGVAWTGLFHPAYKMSPQLTRNGPRLYRVMLESGADAEVTADDITGAGAQISRRGGNVIVISATGAQLDAIAHIMNVAWIENYAFPEKHNFYARGILGADVANLRGGSRDYDGSTQTIAIADSGLDDGVGGVGSILPNSRVTEIFNWEANSDPFCFMVRGDGPQDVESGHGTHVAVSAAGEGTQPGTAPAANIVFQAVEDWINTRRFCSSSPDGYYFIGIPLDLRDLFQQAYDVNENVRVHSNSWGFNAAGAYTTDSANTDDFIWNNPDLTITTSAGNAGPGGDTIGSPATAKNVISVGASENDRNGDIPCDPTLENEDQPDATCTGGNNGGHADADNADQMVGFSSRGPTDDGRIKPDLAAPGSWVLSGYSSMYQSDSTTPDNPNPRNDLHQWNGNGVPPSLTHKYMFGTSMANPLVAGAAAVVRDYYQKEYAHNASAALVKATLINTAVDMNNADPIPNMNEGWGRVDLDGATAGHAYVDDIIGLATSGSASFDFAVAAAGSPFRVSLVWSDYPSTTSATSNLVNDLDLMVTHVSTDGITTTTYRGNNFSGGWSLDGGSADRVNNVENVYIELAGAGIWTVTVSGYNVPIGIETSNSQPFALVVDGDTLDAGDTLAPIPDPMTWAFEGAPVATTTSDITMTATTATDDSGGAVQYYFECTTVGCDDSGWQSSTSYTASGLSDNTTYTFRVKARDGSFNETGWSPLASATTLPDTTAPSPSTMTWENVPLATSTSDITMTATTATDDSGSVEYHFDCESDAGCADSGWQSSTSYTAENLVAETSYTFQVKARDGATTPNETGLSSALSATTEADGGGTGTVDSAVVAYMTEGGKFGDKHLNVTVTASYGGSTVSGASITIELSIGGILDLTKSGTTGASGTVTFSRKNHPPGIYTTKVKADEVWLADDVVDDGELDKGYTK